jgi:hypothetical protein
MAAKWTIMQLLQYGPPKGCRQYGLEPRTLSILGNVSPHEDTIIDGEPVPLTEIGFASRTQMGILGPSRLFLQSELHVQDRSDMGIILLGLLKLLYGPTSKEVFLRTPTDISSNRSCILL